jgi:amidohydrolase
MTRLLLFLCFVWLSIPLVAQDPEVNRAVERLAPEMIAIRHHLHEHPELSNREFETAALVADRLRELGLEVSTGVARTGVVGILRGGRPGPVIAVRADMDALPVTEDTPYPFKSLVRTTYLGQEVGVSHACGHDIHTSVQIGVAAVLASMRDDLPGTVKFIFQPAEEGPPPGEEGGAPLMVEEGVLENPRPEAIFGLHASAALDVGIVGYTPGPALAAADRFRIRVIGRGAHGAAPHLAIDPIVMAAQAVQALQTIRSRTLPPLEPSVVTVGLIRGGTRMNIIPDEVEMQGTVRSYSAETSLAVEKRMNEILTGVTAAGGGSFDLEYVRVTPATINDTALTVRMLPSISGVVGSSNVRRVDPWMAAEDFAYFANEVPGFYFMLGIVKPGTATGDHHTPTFMADDGAVPIGIRVMSQVLLDYLRGGSESN